MTAQRLELDYIRAPRRSRWLGYVVLAFSLAIAGAITSLYRDAQRTLAGIRASSDLLGAGPRSARVVPQKRLRAQMQTVQAVLRRLTLPWGALLQAVEQAEGPDVALLKLEPDPLRQRLRLTAEARDQTAMLAYLKRLSGSTALTDVQLVSHRERPDQPRKPIQFAVQASLREAP